MSSHKKAHSGSGSSGGANVRTQFYSSPEGLSDLIGGIYDCVLNPANWAPVLELICREFSFASSILGVQRLPAGLPICQVSVGIEADWLAEIPKFGPEILEVWGGFGRLQSYAVGEPVVNSQAVNRASIAGNRYLQEWTNRGMIDAVALIVARNDAIMGNVAFNRHRSAGAVGEAEVAGLRLLAPHICRAVTISNLFDMKAVAAASFEAVIDRLACGVVVTDADLGIVHANAAATRMLAVGDPIHAKKGTLSLLAHEAQAALERAVHDAAIDDGSLGHKGIGIPSGSKSERPAAVHVMPLRRNALRQGLASRAAVALFVVPGEAGPRIPIEALALVYDLTPAETGVLERVCAGATQAAIGRSLGIATSTVKTHLLHIFQKTGCERQVDLVRLATSLAAPL